MITTFYACLCTVLIIYLAFQVINARRKHKVAYGDGGVDELAQRRGAHENATQYIPIALILLFLLEHNNGSVWLVHAGGLLLVASRAIHAFGMLSPDMKMRVLGMQTTFAALALLAIINLLYLIF